MTVDAETTPADYPPGEYAIVELFGHTMLVGRISEIERFGAKMLAIEPLFRGTMLPAVFHGGASIYRFTPCSAAVAWEQQPRHAWSLPAAIRSILGPDQIAAPAASSTHEHDSETTDVEDETGQDDGDDELGSEIE